MIHLPKFSGFLAAIVCCHLLQAEDKKISLDDDQVNQLAAGEVIFLEPEAGHMLKAVIRIDAPSLLAWEVMSDHERVPKYVKELRGIRILEEGENWKIIEHKLRMHTLLPLFHYAFREEYGPGYSINFERVSGSFKELTGSWKLIPQEDENHALLVYSTFVDVGWFIPQSWIQKGINKRVPLLLKAFRDEVYSEKEKRATEEDRQ
jgi:ribosome-associated toxin RatA of RatAB toxin-antitoxin module